MWQGNRAPSPGEGHERTDASRAHVALLVVGLAAAALRLVFLADFPDVQTDEGLWTNSTKNFVLFGDWFMDERRHVFLSPVFHGLSLLAFKMLGPSMEAARLVSALAGVASVLLVYLLALRLTGERLVAVTAAAVMAFDPWATFHSRQAMTESVLVCLILASAVLVVGRGRDVALAGVLFGLAILTKLNAASMGVALGGYLLLREAPEGQGPAWRTRLRDGVVFGVVALGVAALGYWAISRLDPERFVAIFQREFAGGHVTGADGADVPDIHAGRWALDPVLGGRSALEVIRLDPFLVCFGILGGVLAWARRERGWLFLALWVGVALAFPLTQVYQPLRYFFPVVPALAILAGVLLVRLGDGPHGARRATAAALAVFIAFGSAYTAMNFLVNRGNRVALVADWLRENANPEDVVVASPAFATDPPNPVYARDFLPEGEGGFFEAASRLGVRFVLWDEAEWSPGMREALDRRYALRHRWDFGEVYELVDGSVDP